MHETQTEQKAVRVRTSITMEENTLRKVQDIVNNPDSAWKNVSQFIESAVNQQVRALP